MNKTLVFMKRNLKEMIRDPLIYIFCAGFPILMVLMFQIILKYTGEKTPVFEVKSLIPGIMMFSYSMLMLIASLLISKDKTSAFLKRLYTSPMKSHDYIIGYFIPFIIIGLIQSIICIILGYICGAISGTGFISFGSSILLIIEMSPMMAIDIFMGMIFATLLNEKSAPAVTSIFISLCGVIGGAWMPLDSMGNFENVATALPFYPSVYLGRVITKALHTLPDSTGNLICYTFSDRGALFLIILFCYLILFGSLTVVFFNKRLKNDC
ncbi:MAG: ABC transporter permease [Acholeplasmatales bacterium]|nr:ABC transporter permease [Acholeplasmatales bacterium]